MPPPSRLSTLTPALLPSTWAADFPRNSSKRCLQGQAVQQRLWQLLWNPLVGATGIEKRFCYLVLLPSMFLSVTGGFQSKSLAPGVVSAGPSAPTACRQCSTRFRSFSTLANPNLLWKVLRARDQGVSPSPFLALQSPPNTSNPWEKEV